MSANSPKLSYEKFTKELRKNYNVYKYQFVNKMAHICIPNTKVSKNRLLLHDLSDDRLYWMTDSRNGPLTNF